MTKDFLEEVAFKLRPVIWNIGQESLRSTGLSKGLFYLMRL